MTNRFKSFLVVAAAAVSLFLGSRSAQAVPIYAGQHILVGDASAFISDSVLYVYVYIDPAWNVSEMHFQPVSDVSEFPVTRKGSPKNGQFDYDASAFSIIDFFGTPVFYTAIPLSTLPNPQSPTICAAFHAVVSPAPGSGIEGKAETAWASGIPFIGGNWASYFCITGGPGQDQ